MFFSSGSDTSLLPFNMVPSVFEGSIVSKEEFVPVSITDQSLEGPPLRPLPHILHAFDVITMQCLL